MTTWSNFIWYITGGAIIYLVLTRTHVVQDLLSVAMGKKQGFASDVRSIKYKIPREQT